MKLSTADRTPSTRELRWFAGLGLPVLGGVLGALCVWKLDALPLGVACWVIAGLLSLAGLLHPPLMLPVLRGLRIVTTPIRWIAYHGAVVLIYFLVFTPIGLLMRCFRRSPLRTFRVPGESSCWQPRPPAPGPERYFHQH